MRRIICRFRNNEDLIIFSNKIGIELNKNTKEVNMKDMASKEKKPSIKRGMKNLEWQEHWVDMPEFNIDFRDEVYAKIDFLFDDNMEKEYISDLFEQNITNRTTSVWYPKLEFGVHRDLRVLGGENPKYPIYVVSKGRSWLGISHTSKRLSQMCVKHYLVVEPQEYDIYCENFNDEYVAVLKMDMKYKDTYDTFSDLGNVNSTGAGAVRNFCWDHSISNGFKWHWVLDDNIEGFNRFWRGHKLLCRTGEVFRSCERFVERYDNIAIGGLNYAGMCKQNDLVPPYVLNTRIYSMLLIRNDIPYRWRGRYNEDTDLSLRVLKDGWCTIQFNSFLGEKRCTQQKKGGNTDEFYAKEGTIPKSQMLVDMHPDVAKMVYKFNRWHHHVDYSGFKQKLRFKDNVKLNKEIINDKGLYIIRIPKDLCNTENDNRKYIEENFNHYEKVNETNLYL